MNQNFPKRLNNVIRMLSKYHNLRVTRQPKKEKYGSDYDAYTLEISNLFVYFRSAKVTPKKIGQFVTLWKKPLKTNMPVSSQDEIDLLIVDVSTIDKNGQFIFSKEILIEKGILTSDKNVGKMAFRVYPPWDVPTVKQAIKTQEWQLDYFFNGSEENFNLLLIKKLFG